MGKLNIFTVALDQSVYYAGQLIKGTVTVDLVGDMAMQGIILDLEGKALVMWSERDGSGKKKRTRHYHAEEIYFNQEFVLFGTTQEDNKSILSAGRHTFDFQFQPPSELPSSFEAETGHVRYLAKCRVARPWKFNHNTKTPFTVISILDLNTQPSSTQQKQGRNSYNLCCLCCKSGPIEATFHIERRGYVPGEAVRLFADISNGANRVMDGSFVQLKMVTTFRTAAKTKTEVTSVAQVKRPSIQGHGEDTWTGETLVIPPLPPSFLVGCKIIEIHYILELNVDPSGWGVNLEIPLEILVGTIPLASVVEQNPPKEHHTPQPGCPGEARPNLPRPSFSECVTGKVNVRESGDNEFVRGDLNYAPVYTFYDWGHKQHGMPHKNN